MLKQSSAFITGPESLWSRYDAEMIMVNMFTAEARRLNLQTDEINARVKDLLDKAGEHLAYARQLSARAVIGDRVDLIGRLAAND